MNSLPSSLPHRRVATWWTSDAARERQRLIPAWIALGFGALVLGGLALLFPFRGIEAELERAGPRPDALQIAYLEAWLTARPDREQLRYLLARQLVAAKAHDRARAHLALLAAASDRRVRDRAELLELDIALGELQALAPGHPQRELRVQAVRERFRALLARGPPADIGIGLAQRAAEAGIGEVMVEWYERMLRDPPALPAAVWEVAARTTLGAGEFRLAARLWLRASQAASTRAEQRRLFIEALRTLQAASLFDEALALAEAHLDAFATDTVVLEYLTRLALAAGRPDLAQRYAILLMRIALLPQAIERLQQAGRPVPPAWLALRERSGPQVVRTQASAAPAGEHERTAHLPFDDALYSLSFEVFVANGNLRDAIVVARSAVRQVPRNLRWRRKLAQAADWAGQPHLALEQWHAIARVEGGAAAWSEVRRRASQLHAIETWVEALEFAHARAPGEAATLQELARAYEELGRPEQAIALLAPVLAEPARTPARRARLDLLAALAERSGDLATQRAALQALLRDHDDSPALALRLAALEYGIGDAQAAVAALRVALPRALGDVAVHREFWTVYAEMARVAGRRDDALRAYRLLLAAGVAGDEVTINTAALLEDDDPREAAHLYDRVWQRSGRADLAAQALYLLLRLGDAAAVRAWMARLTPAQLALLEANPRWLAQRATIRLADGQARAALADARRAHKLQPDDAGLEALLIWTLIAARDAPALRAQLAASVHAGGGEPQLWGPFAAGWMSLHEPRRAIRFLRLQAGGGTDPLWTLSYADALDQLGQRDLAWSLRRHAWLGRDALLAEASSPVERLALQRRIVPLAAALVGGDAARAQLDVLLAADAKAATSATRESALSYWIARERSEIAAAWLLGQYAGRLARPAWAELSVALAHDDRARIETLLDSVADWLPLYDRIEAADRVGRTAQAQTLAFDALTALPDSDELHRRLVERVAGDRSATAPQAIGWGAGRLRQRPIDETTWSAEGSVLLSPRVRLGAAFDHSTRTSTDAAQLADPPRHDTTARIELGYDLGIDRRLHLALSQRDGLAREPGWRLQGGWRAADRLSVAAAIGQGQPSTDNAYLRVGAVRDLFILGLSSRFAQRQFAALTFESSRFDAQGGGHIGDGRTIRLEIGHALRTEYPDLSLRLSVADLRYTPAPGAAGALLPLLPAAARATAGNAQFLPQSTQRIGAALVFGETARERYARAWRPFGVIGIDHDRAGGTDYAWTLGAGGSLLGADELSLVVAAGSGTGVQPVPFRSYGLRYRWMF